LLYGRISFVLEYDRVRYAAVPNAQEVGAGEVLCSEVSNVIVRKVHPLEVVFDDESGGEGMDGLVSNVAHAQVQLYDGLFCVQNVIQSSHDDVPNIAFGERGRNGDSSGGSDENLPKDPLGNLWFLMSGSNGFSSVVADATFGYRQCPERAFDSKGVRNGGGSAIAHLSI